MSPRSLFRAVAAAALLAVLAACARTPEPWQLDDVSGHLPNLAFKLTSDIGNPVTASDYAGKVNILYFGYTHCPDVCPLTLTHLHVMLQRLGAAADGVHVLFVSVDPARDTPDVLHEYVTAFDSHVTGLTGTPQQVEALAKRYRAAFSRDPGDANDKYEVSHSSAIYVFDRNGRARLLGTPINTVDQITHDVKRLLAEHS